MKRIIVIICLLLLSPGARAQRGERIHAIKVAYLTDRLHLSSSQAATFWPVYDDYEGEIKEARRAIRRQKRAGDGTDMSDAEAGQAVEDNLDFQEQALTIKRKYKDQFLKLISPQQLVTLYEAEQDFKKLLLQRLREQRGRR